VSLSIRSEKLTHAVAPFKSIELLRRRYAVHLMRFRIGLKLHRVISLLAFVLATIGGLLIALSALRGFDRLTLGSFAINGLALLFGLGAIFGLVAAEMKPWWAFWR